MKAPYIPKVNIQNEDGNLKNKRTLFLPLIQKYKFEKFSDVNEKKKMISNIIFYLILKNGLMNFEFYRINKHYFL